MTEFTPTGETTASDEAIAEQVRKAFTEQREFHYPTNEYLEREYGQQVQERILGGLNAYYARESAPKTDASGIIEALGCGRMTYWQSKFNAPRTQQLADGHYGELVYDGFVRFLKDDDEAIVPELMGCSAVMADIDPIDEELGKRAVYHAYPEPGILPLYLKHLQHLGDIKRVLILSHDRNARHAKSKGETWFTSEELAAFLRVQTQLNVIGKDIGAPTSHYPEVYFYPDGKTYTTYYPATFEDMHDLKKQMEQNRKTI